MESGLKQTAQRATSAFLIALVITIWAVSSEGTAHSLMRQDEPRAISTALPDYSTPESNARKGRSSNARRLPSSARFREVEGRGLIVRTWINNSGPYNFAIDTGAGATIISQRVAYESKVALLGGRPVSLSGLSGVRGAAGREGALRSLSIGASGNVLPATGFVIVSDALPADLDGVLDPTESYFPLGYIIDLPNNTISAFDPRLTPLRGLAAPEGGAIVPWLFDGNSRRPFVLLDTGRRVLLDTGSGFGFAVSETAARAFGIISGRGRAHTSAQDLGRGRVEARRVEPVTVHLGSLVLRRVPTDLLSGAARSAPVLLGRDALRPFEISFDPVSRLIRLRPGEETSRR